MSYKWYFNYLRHRILKYQYLPFPSGTNFSSVLFPPDRILKTSEEKTKICNNWIYTICVGNCKFRFLFGFNHDKYINTFTNNILIFKSRKYFNNNGTYRFEVVVYFCQRLRCCLQKKKWKTASYIISSFIIFYYGSTLIANFYRVWKT